MQKDVMERLELSVRCVLIRAVKLRLSQVKAIVGLKLGQIINA
jgi:hypothetical protein